MPSCRRTSALESPPSSASRDRERSMSSRNRGPLLNDTVSKSVFSTARRTAIGFLLQHDQRLRASLACAFGESLISLALQQSDHDVGVQSGLYHSWASTRSHPSSMAWIISRADAGSRDPENLRSAAPFSPFGDAVRSDATKRSTSSCISGRAYQRAQQFHLGSPFWAPLLFRINHLDGKRASKCFPISWKKAGRAAALRMLPAADAFYNPI